MGRGDKRTRRGKISAKSNGNSRPTEKKINRAKKDVAAKPAK
ncbi:hypothetical protein BAC3_00622 [uncultured bacterium]|nr:hypothetical protein BAC3_00622 [uncultured bacterium]